MGDFVKCFVEVGVDYINLMMTDKRMDAKKIERSQVSGRWPSIHKTMLVVIKMILRGSEGTSVQFFKINGESLIFLSR